MLGLPVTNMRKQIAFPTLPNGEKTWSEMYVFTCSDPTANSVIGSHDQRYVERLKSGKGFERKGRNYPRFGGDGFDKKGCSLSRIVSIEHQPSEPVYDLEVEGTHSFVANGVVVHNSNIEHQSLEFVRDCMNPLCVRIEQTAYRDLLTESERVRYYFKVNTNALLRGDTAARTAYYNSARQNGWMNGDEIRELEEMNKMPDGQGQIYMVNGNMIPVSAVPLNLPKGAQNVKGA
jgi:hypothetical protein